MKDQFDLENEITHILVFAKHLRDLSFNILENNLSTDETVNALEGLAVLIDSHEKVLFDTFIQVLKLDKYHEPTV